MILYEELVRVFRQMLGKENIFGYKTTLANQAYLMYCILGKIHTTDKIHWQLRFLWLVLRYFSLVLTSSLTILYLIFDSKNNVSMLLYILFMEALVMSVILFFPLLTFWFGNEIEAMIDHTDQIMTKNSSHTLEKHSAIINVNRMMLYFSLLIFVPMTVFYNWVCMLDVVTLYEEEKITNFYYYTAGVPCLQCGIYTSVTFYFCFNILVAFLSTIVYVESIVFCNIFVLWAVVCHNNVVVACDNLRNQSNALIAYVEANKRYGIHTSKRSDEVGGEKNHYETIEGHHLRKALVSCMKTLRESLQYIGHLNGYFQLVSSVCLALTFFCQLVHSLIFLSVELPLPVKCREVVVYFVTAFTMLLFCMVGDILGSLTEYLSLEIYSVPWYYLSPFSRKEVQVFLSQTQIPITRGSPVYPMSLNTFKLYIRGVYSTVNVVRTVIMK